VGGKAEKARLEEGGRRLVLGISKAAGGGTAST
jgi:hypothetical protein